MAKSVGKIVSTRALMVIIFSAIVVAGIIVGTLYGTGLLGKKSKGSPTPGTPGTPVKPSVNPLGPGPGNPAYGEPIGVTLSNPKILYQSGNPPHPIGVGYSIKFSPSDNDGNTPAGVGNWDLHTNAVLTYPDGTTTTVTNVYHNSVSEFEFDFQPLSGGMNRQPWSINMNAYVTYETKYGNTITGNWSNIVSIGIPSVSN
jgi:hypothetical protein